MPSSTRTKNWPYTFAPKRKTWHADFFAPKLSHMNVTLGVFNVSLFLFLAVFSVTMLPKLASLHVPQVAIAGGNAKVIDAMLPQQGTVGFPRSVAYENDLHTAQEFAGNFAQSLVDTTASAWQNSFGFAGSVYVASVYEFLHQAGDTASAELNSASVWDAWTDLLYKNLYAPNSPGQMLTPLDVQDY